MILNSNPAQGIYVCLVFYVVLSCAGRGEAMCPSPVLGVLFFPKYLQGFTVPEINSEPEQARQPNP